MARSKYNNTKVEIDGFKFDSKREVDYYLYLKKQKEEGQIADFSLQPKFTLQEKFRKRGKLFRAITYKADFKVVHLDGHVDIIDIKGVQTTAFKLKQKMFEYKFEEDLILLTYVKKFGGWIEVDEAERLRKLEKQKNLVKNSLQNRKF